MIAFGYLVNALGGALFIVLGAWVATLRPRRPSTTAFALYSIAFGVTFGPQNLVSADLPDAANAALMATSAAGALAACAGMLLLAVRFPEGAVPSRVPPVAALLFAGGAMVALLLALTLTSPSETLTPVGPLADPPLRIDLLLGIATTALLGMVLAYAALAAAPFGGVPTGEARGQNALLASALVLFPGFVSGAAAASPDQVFRPFGVAAVALAGVAAVVWLRAARGPHARPAMRTALLCLAAPLAGMVASAALGSFRAVDASGLFGVVRTLSILLLAYAILRHQLLGIDLKVKWTIKQSTVAAVFIAVFFVVSEGAQAVFSEGAGPLVGIVAAGALVFAIAPLQRAAERVASAAVPLAGTPAPEEAEPLAFYRAQLELAWADGRITAKERLLLRNLRERLGLGAAEAERAEAEVMRAAAARAAVQGPRRGRP